MSYLADEWGWRRDVLTGLGIEAGELDRREDALVPVAVAPVARGAARAAEIRAFVAEFGGELG